ncbi:Terminase large subunit (Gp2) [Escherichia coli]|nr:Terminase large subunit (Gp2) [Escherichia coli]
MKIPPPRSITFHIWTAYSPFTTWVQIVYDWLDALKDPNGLKTFVNTTLGETWEEAVGEKLDHQVLMDKVVHYTAAVPARVVYLTAALTRSETVLRCMSGDGHRRGSFSGG